MDVKTSGENLNIEDRRDWKCFWFTLFSRPGKMEPSKIGIQEVGKTAGPGKPWKKHGKVSAPMDKASCKMSEASCDATPRVAWLGCQSPSIHSNRLQARSRKEAA